MELGFESIGFAEIGSGRIAEQSQDAPSIVEPNEVRNVRYLWEDEPDRPKAKDTNSFRPLQVRPQDRWMSF